MEHTYAQCKDTCVGYRHSGENPLSVKGKQAAKDIKDGSAWLDMRQAWAIWLKCNVREDDIKLNKAGRVWNFVFNNKLSTFFFERVPGLSPRVDVPIHRV